jgi:hypothetical protein
MGFAFGFCLCFFVFLLLFCLCLSFVCGIEHGMFYFLFFILVHHVTSSMFDVVVVTL